MGDQGHQNSLLDHAKVRCCLSTNCGYFSWHDNLIYLAPILDPDAELIVCRAREVLSGFRLWMSINTIEK
jgi:hypothetical protein